MYWYFNEITEDVYYGLITKWSCLDAVLTRFWGVSLCVPGHLPHAVLPAGSERRGLLLLHLPQDYGPLQGSGGPVNQNQNRVLVLIPCVSLQASEMLLFNKKLTATQACEAGLVTEVFPDGGFQTEAWRRLKAYARLPPQVGTDGRTDPPAGPRAPLMDLLCCSLSSSRWRCPSSWSAAWTRSVSTPWTTRRWSGWWSAGPQRSASTPSWASSRPRPSCEEEQKLP